MVRESPFPSLSPESSSTGSEDRGKIGNSISFLGLGDLITRGIHDTDNKVGENRADTVDRGSLLETSSDHFVYVWETAIGET